MKFHLDKFFGDVIKKDGAALDDDYCLFSGRAIFSPYFPHVCVVLISNNEIEIIPCQASACISFTWRKMYIFDWLGYSAIADADAEAQKKK